MEVGQRDVSLAQSSGTNEPQGELTIWQQLPLQHRAQEGVLRACSWSERSIVLLLHPSQLAIVALPSR